MVKKFQFLLPILLAWAMVPSGLRAADIKDQKSLVEIGSRIFDMRTDVSKIPHAKHFFPLTEIRWFQQMKEQDPLLESTILHIRVRQQTEGQPYQTFFSIREGENIARNYPSRNNIPEIFQIDGFEARRSQSGLILYPTDRNNKLLITCAIWDMENLFCSLITDYPPDPLITLKVRIYYPEPPFHFSKVADRVREIAYCLDVTDQINAGEFIPKLVHKDDPNLPVLKGCREVVS